MVDPVSGGPGVGPFDSRKKFRELIEPPGSSISDDTLKNVPFFPSMGAHAVKKYFTPKWEEFTSYRELEDVLEAGLTATVRTTSLQLKVLGKFQTRMQEHQQALEGLQPAVDSMRMAYEQLQANLRESDSNVLQLTKQLDNANAVRKVAAEALEATNIEKRCLQSEYESREMEAQLL
ncbi:hypothetical protein Adt_27760 [Abeliophyllum distichum]|uniref:Uncharacterized protein n=1 Tax=Abeliophyllum distichum TaxID=126358 RepID=A0ABD1RUM6_9LAMI